MRDIIYHYDAGPTLCCMVLLFVYVLLLGYTCCVRVSAGGCRLNVG